MTIDQALSEFVDAWNAGRRPKVDEWLDRVPEEERDELADALLAWLEVAPTPAYDDAALAAIRAEPVLARLRAEQGALPQVLPALRARRGIALRELAQRVAAAAGLPGEDARAAAYLERLERGDLDGARLSRRLLDALAGALGASREALADAAALAVPLRPAAGVQYRREEDGAWWGEELDALTAAAFTPAPEAPLDELDRLFLGGHEA